MEEIRKEFDLHCLDCQYLMCKNHDGLKKVYSALQSAREKLDLHIDILKQVQRERDTIKAEAARMREAILKYVPAMLRAGYHMAGVDCPNGESRELWQRAAHDVEDFILRPSITPPAAPEKAERINDKQEKYLNDQDKSLNII